MKAEAIQQQLLAAFPDCEVTVTGDGYHHEITIIGECFTGKRPVARQQMVYQVLQEAIQRGDIHAVNIKAMSNAEAAN